MRNIKEIKAEMSKLRAEYDAAIIRLQEEIVQVREKRGYVPVEPSYEDYYEPGRSRERTHGWK